jgi:hypothetical protein
MLRIPGMRQERVRKLYKELGIASAADLEDAALSGRLAATKGFGALPAQGSPGHRDDPRTAGPPSASRADAGCASRPMRSAIVGPAVEGSKNVYGVQENGARWPGVLGKHRWRGTSRVLG